MAEAKSENIAISMDRIYAIGDLVADLMNKLQEQGYTIDEVLGGLLYMTGAAIKQRGVIVSQYELDALMTSFDPIVWGYENAKYTPEIPN